MDWFRGIRVIAIAFGCERKMIESACYRIDVVVPFLIEEFVDLQISVICRGEGISTWTSTDFQKVENVVLSNRRVSSREVRPYESLGGGRSRDMACACSQLILAH
jgi:hypothetical protein